MEGGIFNGRTRAEGRRRNQVKLLYRRGYINSPGRAYLISLSGLWWDDGYEITCSLEL